MKVKIDTKEKFHVISIQEANLSANMTEELMNKLRAILEEEVKNVVLNLRGVETMDVTCAEEIASIQQSFYDKGYSFVICEAGKALDGFLDREELLETMNIVPTESEAGDMVMMEEIEREMF